MVNFLTIRKILIIKKTQMTAVGWYITRVYFGHFTNFTLISSLMVAISVYFQRRTSEFRIPCVAGTRTRVWQAETRWLEAESGKAKWWKNWSAIQTQKVQSAKPTTWKVSLKPASFTKTLFSLKVLNMYSTRDVNL